MSAGSMTTKVKQLLAKHLWLFVLFLIHLPFMGLEFVRLWNLEHYQFFPFALGAFAYFVFQRRFPGNFHWTTFGWCLVVLDVLLLVAAFYLRSPLFAYAGAIALTSAVCRAIPDAQYESSLGYLVLLLLITVRLPQGLDMDAIHWLQRMTTGVASHLLNHLGFLHLCSGNVLEFPGKRFLVEEACSGVQSLFTLLFLAAIITCGYRRKLFHTLLVLLSAACFAGLLNILRVAAISIAWSEYQHDLSVGWQHDLVGHLALVIAAALVYSADATIEFICSPVPDAPGARLSAVYLNPITSCWNWLFLVQRRKFTPAPQSAALVEAKDKSPVGYVDDVNVRERATFVDIIRPRNLVAWLSSFVESWFMSRNYRRLLMALPFLAVGVGGTFYLSWLRGAPQDALVGCYEVAAAEALQRDDTFAAGLYLQGAVQLRPLNQRTRFQLVLHLMENDQMQAAASHLETLTGADGYTPARLWLVSQAISGDPKIPLSTEQIQHQLRAVVSREPNNVLANQVLADLALKGGQFTLAENYLLNAVESNPGLSLPLAKVQRMLNRPADQVNDRLTASLEIFESHLLKNPANTDARVNAAEVLVMQGKLMDAERLLREGMANNDSAKLKQALASLYSSMAAKRLQESVLNRDLCKQLVIRAMSLDPANRKYLRQAFSLSSAGATFTMPQLQPAVDAIQATDVATTDDQILVARAIATGGDPQAAAERVAPLIDEHPELRRTYAGFLKFAGEKEKANALIQQLLSEIPVDGSADLKAICDRAELLLFSSRTDEARNLLMQSKPQADRPQEQGRRWNVMYGRACLAVFDQNQQSDQLSKDSLSLLDEALITNTAALGIIERLVRVSCSDSPLAQSADDRLVQLLASGNASAQVYNLVGTEALSRNDAEKAKRYLERAHSLSKNDPMVLNNLALAVLRSADGSSNAAANGNRALQLAEDALKILPDHPDVLSTRGEILIAQERWEDARRDLEVALPKRHKSANIRRLLVRVFEALGEPSLAAEHSRQLQKLSDETE